MNYAKWRLSLFYKVSLLHLPLFTMSLVTVMVTDSGSELMKERKSEVDFKYKIFKKFQ